MELTDILSLVKAGYTRNEIAQMEQNASTVPNTVPIVEPDATNTPAPETTEVPTAEPVPEPKPAQQPVQSEPTMAELMQSIAKLTSAVQANAIAQSVIPQGLQNTPKAEDMLAEIIRPSFHRRDAE